MTRMKTSRRELERPVSATVPSILLEFNDGSDAFPRMHQVESLVDALQRQLMPDQGIDADLAVHVPVHDLRHLGTAARPAKGRALPYPARHQLEGAGLDLLPRTGHADDDAHPPAAMGAFQRLAHQIDIADTLKG